jgi:translation initiation factor 1 (eIF-1/SUI1)
MGKKDRKETVNLTLDHVPRDSPFAVLAGVTVAPGPAAPDTAPGPETGSGTRAPVGPGSRGRLVLRRETKHRGGKAVIVVSGLGAIEGFDLQTAEVLASRLKRQLGCGGTVEATDGALELVFQGDRPGRVAELLRAEGFRVDGVTT